MRRSVLARLLAAAAVALPATRAAAQPPPPAACVDGGAYARCALGVAPRLRALDVVRGVERERAGSLDFFWPRDVRAAFAGSDEAERHARRALRRRRVGAALTDVGGIVLALGAAQVARRGDLRQGGGALTLGGLALVGASVAPQFAADDALGRAVWAYNARFGR